VKTAVWRKWVIAGEITSALAGKRVCCGVIPRGQVRVLFTVVSTSPEDSRWFTLAVQSHEAELRGYLRRQFPALDDFDDLVQEAFGRLWRSHLLGPVANPRAFLFAVARNLAFDRHRARSGFVLKPITETDAENVFDEEPSAAEHASRTQEREILRAAIRSLPDRCREVVLLRYMDSLTYKEIAQRLNISPETVKIHLAKGLRRCVAHFQNAEGKSP
jgi:RNA polymerase sigma-70 factor (ECF subfamily)